MDVALLDPALRLPPPPANFKMTYTMSGAACDTAWGIPEVCDHILLYLPLHDLRNAVRVCKTWAASSKVREVLFLKPRASHSVHIAASSNDCTATYEKDHLETDPWIAVSNTTSGDIPEFRSCKPVLNPFFPFDRSDFRNSGVTIPIELLCSKNYFKEPNILFKDPGASWQSRQFVQPPAARVRFLCLGGHVECLEIDHEYDPVTPKKYNAISIVNRRGVTIGEVFQALGQHFNSCKLCLAAWKLGRDEWFWSFRGSKQVRLVSKKRTGHQVLAAIRKCEGKVNEEA